MTSAPSLSFEPRISRIALLLTAVIATLAIIAIALSGLPGAGRFALAAAVAIAAVRTWLRLRRVADLHCALQADRNWLIRTANGEFPGTLDRAHDLGFLIALHLHRDDGRRVDVVLWPDSIDPDTRRRLRLWLGRAGRY